MKRKCENCIYEKDAERLLVDGYIVWACSEPHPCYNCIRFPTKLKKPDNYSPIIIGGSKK